MDGGYEEGASVQTADTIFGLKLVFSVATFAFAMLGLCFFRKYPVTEASHAEVLRNLRELRGQAGEA